jgi:hypothetical protein
MKIDTALAIALVGSCSEAMLAVRQGADSIGLPS